MGLPLPNLRIRLRASKRVARSNRSRPQTTPPPTPPPMQEQEGQTSKFQTPESPPQVPPESVKTSWRLKLKEKNPHKYELNREIDMKRSQLYRLEMTDAEKGHANQLAKIRQRRYRQRKKKEKEAQRKEEEKKKIKYGNTRKTRSDHQKELDMRKKQTERKRKYRQNCTAEQCEEKNRMRRKAYAAKKERERMEHLERERKEIDKQIQREMEQQVSLEYLDLPHTSFSCSSAARRKRLSRVKQLLPLDSTKYAEVVVDMISKTSPRKRVALQNAGVINDRKRRSMEIEITNIVAKEAKIKGRKKFMTAALEDLKKARLQRYASRHLGINRKAITKGSKKKTGRKQVSQETVDLVKNFYEQVAHAVPFKKLVSKKTGKP